MSLGKVKKFYLSFYKNMVLGPLYPGWVGHDKTGTACRVFGIQHEVRTRVGRGKSFICAVLGAALKAAVELQALQESVQVTQKLV